ncbi:protein kinase [Trypanosoma rangeli SC58]|uniref:non-specific serine/threonine protein kinase n=1 Tax=Trypanosoma rangeli SC58 TaxID=429131 RepID=A0A061J368_TRYRA|nr:protein kinase [Trypanosoma rangeli SC58]
MLNAYLRIRLLILCILALGLSLDVGDTRLLSVSAAQVVPQDVNLLHRVETETVDRVAPAAGPDFQELVPSYRLRHPSMLLLLQKDGKISSYGFDDGKPLWTVDTGGDILRVKIQQHAREPVISQDPFALPFTLEGGVLFTRRCFPPCQCWSHTSDRCCACSGTDVETRSNEEEVRDSTNGRSGTSFSQMHPRCFMNLSTLIEKRHVLVGDTDIFVTTSAQIIDVDGHNGKPAPEPFFLFSYLHIVRYDFTLNVRRPGYYSWKMIIAQYKVSEKSPLRVSEEDRADDDPTFVSHALQGLLQRGDCDGKGHVPFTNDGGKAGKGSMEPATVDEGFHKDIFSKQLMIREIDRDKYILWSKLKDAAVWPSVVNSLSTVTSAFVWLSDGGGVQSLPIYPFEATASIKNVVELLALGSTDLSYLPVFVKKEPQRNNISFNLNRSPSTWEFDIVADELELRELQNSYQQCSWIRGCDGSAGNLPNSLPNDSNSKTSSQLALVPWFPLSRTGTGSTLLVMFNSICGFISFSATFFSVVIRWYMRHTGVGHEVFVDHNIGNSPVSGLSKPNLLHRSFTLERSVACVDDARGKLGLSCTPELWKSSTPTTPLQDNEMHPSCKTSMIGTNSMPHMDSWWKHSADDDASLSDKPISESLIAQKAQILPQLFKLQFQIAKKIGSGAEGSVFRVKHQVTGVSYAVKAILIPDDNEVYIQEAVLHSTFDSVNVVRFFNAWVEYVSQSFANKLGLLHRADTMDNLFSETFDTFDGNLLMESTSSDKCYTVLFIQTEWFGRGTLADLFLQRASFTRLSNLTHLLQIAEGLQYLHLQYVVHCDLKPKNIFMSDSGIMKIGDFGLSKKNRTRLRKMCDGTSEATSDPCTSAGEQSAHACTPLYCSPEQKRGETATEASDIYSLGLIALEFYCVFTTQHERYHTLGEARQGVFPREFVEKYPAERVFFQKMLSEDVDGRPAMKDIVSFLRLEIKEEKKDAVATASTTSLSPIAAPSFPNPMFPLKPSEDDKPVTSLASTFNRRSLSSLESLALAHVS